MLFLFFFKQKTAYEMRISDWSSDVCSSDLRTRRLGGTARSPARRRRASPCSLSGLDAAMMFLREYRSRAACLADFLPWVALVAPGAVLNKDGSFQRTARFRGPDLDSPTPPELVPGPPAPNHALRPPGPGGAVFVRAARP